MKYRVTQYVGSKVVAHRDYRWLWVARFVAWSFDGQSHSTGLRFRTEVTTVSP